MALLEEVCQWALRFQKPTPGLCVCVCVCVRVSVPMDQDAALSYRSGAELPAMTMND